MNYREMGTQHGNAREFLGPEATAADVAEFCGICEEAHRLHPEMTADEVTDAVFGEGDYLRNARRLGVDVDAIVAG